MRKRRIQKYGNTWIIKLEPTDVSDYGLVEGDIVDIEELGFLIEIKDKNKRESSDSSLPNNKKKNLHNRKEKEVTEQCHQ